MKRIPAPRQLVIRRGEEYITDQSEIAELMARHFAGNCGEEPDKGERVSLSTSDNQEWYNQPIRITELKRAAQTSKSKVPGLDTMPFKFLQNTSESQLESMLQFFNYIYTHGVPKQWKEPIIVTILKSGKIATELNFYRTVSLTHCLCKGLEKVLHWKLQAAAEEVNYFSSNQSGFRAHHSTLDALACLETTAIRESLICDNYCMAAFIDIDRSFDTVWHQGLLAKLRKVKIGENRLNFIKDFLSQRYIYIGKGKW